MTQPNITPRAGHVAAINVDELRRKRRFWLSAIFISVAVVILQALLGLGVTIFGMVGAFDKLSETEEASPEMLAGDISLALQAIFGMVVFEAIAFLVLIGALIRFYTLPKLSSALPAQP